MIINKIAFLKVASKFILKIFAYKKGASALFSFMTTAFLSIGLNSYFKIFMRDTDEKAMFMPMLVQAIMFGFFFCLALLDLRYGSKVAISRRGEKFDWDRVWDTAAKMFAIFFITSILMVFSMVFESLHSKYLWWIAFIPQCFLWVLSNGFEFGSLGRHIQELRGDKPDIFKFFDKVLDKLQKKAIDKLDNSFNILPEDEEENNNNK